jgi:hypothetical protein
VTLDNVLLQYGTDYTLSGVLVQLLSTPSAGNTLIIARRQSVQLDFYSYFGVTQNSTTGSGTGATFTVTNTRGLYNVTLTAPGTAYIVGEQLTISYTQVDPGGSAANNITVTVTEVVSGGITGFTYTGSAVNNTSVFSLTDYLYTATSYDAFTVQVNGVLQRPYIDYTFNTGTLTFLTVASTAGHHSGRISHRWCILAIHSYHISQLHRQRCCLGNQPTVDQLGRQILAGAPNDSAPDAEGDVILNAGNVYAFDRGVVKYIISDTSQLTYSIPGSSADPVAVIKQSVSDQHRSVH